MLLEIVNHVVCLSQTDFLERMIEGERKQTEREVLGERESFFSFSTSTSSSRVVTENICQYFPHINRAIMNGILRVQ